MAITGSGPFLVCEREERSLLCLHSELGKNPGGELTKKTGESLKDIALLAPEIPG